MSPAKNPGTVTRGAAAPAAAAPTTARPAPGGGARTTEPRPSTGGSGQIALGSTAPRTPKTAATAARKVRLTVSRVDPWSAMKLAFLISVALGIAFVVMTGALWMVLAGMGVFDKVNSIVGDIIQNNGRPFDILDYVGLSRVLSLSIVFAVIDVVLMTAIATLGAFIYNVSANLVGGLHLTLTDD